jgi:hypothetical protein
VRWHKQTVHSGGVRLAAVDTAATRLQQHHPQVKLARLACGHNLPLERPRELADLIGRFAESSAAQLGDIWWGEPA